MHIGQISSTITNKTKKNKTHQLVGFYFAQKKHIKVLFILKAGFFKHKFVEMNLFNKVGWFENATIKFNVT